MLVECKETCGMHMMTEVTNVRMWLTIPYDWLMLSITFATVSLHLHVFENTCTCVVISVCHSHLSMAANLHNWKSIKTHMVALFPCNSATLQSLPLSRMGAPHSVCCICNLCLCALHLR